MVDKLIFPTITDKEKNYRFILQVQEDGITNWKLLEKKGSQIFSGYIVWAERGTFTSTVRNILFQKVKGCF